MNVSKTLTIIDMFHVWMVTNLSVRKKAKNNFVKKRLSCLRNLNKGTDVNIQPKIVDLKC